MFKILNLQPEIFGLDINDLSIKIAKLKKNHKGIKLVSFNETDIKPGIIKEGVIQDSSALAKLITYACNTVKGEQLGTKYVIVPLPEEKSFSQVIQMPKMTEEELRLAVPFEAENYIPLTIDEVYLDFQITNPHKDELDHLDLLINAMPKPIVDSYVACFKEAGLIPCVLEVESQAIARALLKIGEDVLPLILIDFGQTKTSFIIVSGGSIRFTSTIPISSEQLTNSIADKLGISFEKAEELKIEYGLTPHKENNHYLAEAMNPVLNDFVAQIKKHISFYQGHVSHEYFQSLGKIEKVILCGGGSNLRKFPDFLSHQLKINVELGNPLVNITSLKNKISYFMPKTKAMSFSTAFGLALRGAQGQI